MAKTGGPKLSAEQRACIMEMMYAGKGNDEILQAMAERDWPSVSLNTLAKYRSDKRVQAEVDERLEQARLSGMSSRLARIRALEIGAAEHLLYTRGFTPDPLRPCEPLPGPPVPPGLSAFREAWGSALDLFKELDRLVYGHKSTTVLKDGAGNVTGTAETITTHQPSEVSKANALADQLEAFIARRNERALLERDTHGTEAQP